MDQEALLQAARTGDRVAIERIVSDEQRVVRRYLARLAPDAATADDLAQDVFLAAFRSLDRIDPAQGLRGYLLGIARNLARRAWRDLARRREVGGDAVFDSLEASCPPVESDDRLDRLRACLGRLTPQAQKVLQRHYRDGETCEAIAAVVGLAASSVRALMSRSRAALLICLGVPG